MSRHLHTEAVCSDLIKQETFPSHWKPGASAVARRNIRPAGTSYACRTSTSTWIPRAGGGACASEAWDAGRHYWNAEAVPAHGTSICEEQRGGEGCTLIRGAPLSLTHTQDFRPRLQPSVIGSDDANFVFITCILPNLSHLGAGAHEVESAWPWLWITSC